MLERERVIFICTGKELNTAVGKISIQRTGLAESLILRTCTRNPVICEKILGLLWERILDRDHRRHDRHVGRNHHHHGVKILRDLRTRTGNSQNTELNRNTKSTMRLEVKTSMSPTLKSVCEQISGQGHETYRESLERADSTLHFSYYITLSSML